MSSIVSTGSLPATGGGVNVGALENEETADPDIVTELRGAIDQQDVAAVKTLAEDQRFLTGLAGDDGESYLSRLLLRAFQKSNCDILGYLMKHPLLLEVRSDLLKSILQQAVAKGRTDLVGQICLHAEQKKALSEKADLKRLFRDMEILQQIGEADSRFGWTGPWMARQLRQLPCFSVNTIQALAGVFLTHLYQSSTKTGIIRNWVFGPSVFLNPTATLVQLVAAHAITLLTSFGIAKAAQRMVSKEGTLLDPDKANNFIMTSLALGVLNYLNDFHLLVLSPHLFLAARVVTTVANAYFAFQIRSL